MAWRLRGRAALFPPTDPADVTNDLLLRACRREPVERPPVWMMRQAGRYLPEYRAIRKTRSFHEVMRTPELACEVTLQPVDLVGVDAAILFSDILVIPEAMGLGLEMESGVGPRFDRTVRSAADVAGLKPVDPTVDLGYVMDALRLIRRELDGRVPLIGFAGAPWTLASYMIEGQGTKDFRHAKRLLMADPAAMTALLDKLTDAVGDFLVAQIEAGAQVVQLFDSWADALAPAEFRRFALPTYHRIIERVKPTGVPLILFARGAMWALPELAQTGADVLGIDWHIEPAEARRLAGDGVGLQGNLDPAALYLPPDEIRRRTESMIAGFGATGYIANLGHGIFQDTPVDSARAFVAAVKGHAG